jgi:hypothetical protein
MTARRFVQVARLSAGQFRILPGVVHQKRPFSNRGVNRERRLRKVQGWVWRLR